MQIKNKHTGAVHQVTEEGWKTLADLGFAASWQLISREDKPEKKIPVKKLKKYKK